jgi:uncharacterized protein (TIGR02757 family)
MNKTDLKSFLDEKTRQYQQPEFLDSDPIQIPHRFSEKSDIEIAAFLTATIAWGNRLSIIRSADRMMELMDKAPYDFVMNASEGDLKKLEGFVHRTFNGYDFQAFIKGLRHVHSEHNGLETLFSSAAKADGMQEAITSARACFFEIPHPERSEKHFSDPSRGSAAKRLNMFLRWMVRPSDTGVDFGIWTQIKPAHLSCPLDVHSGKVARALGLLTRKQNDARAVQELDRALRKLDPEDPVKYDFALFGLGVFEKFK